MRAEMQIIFFFQTDALHRGDKWFVYLGSGRFILGMDFLYVHRALF